MWLLLLTFLVLPTATVAQTEFNSQVMLRVLERLGDFMTVPVERASRAEQLRQLDLVFPGQLRGQDRDFMIQFLYAEKPTLLYYGLEDGTFMIHASGFTSFSYREPGNSGYRLQHQEESGNEAFLKRNFYNACVDSITGSPQNCTAAAGSQYIQCVENCDLKPCEDQDDNQSQSNFWCPHYTIETVSEEQGEDKALGFVPNTESCVNQHIKLSEGLGSRILDSDTKKLRNCTFLDGATLVNRSHIKGEYQYCQTSTTKSTRNRTTCDNVFTGGFKSANYDPRFRGWYQLARQTHNRTWTNPYVFFNLPHIGITYVQPMHNALEVVGDASNNQVFYGAWAVDMYLEDISRYLTTQYPPQGEMWVVILETKPPYYAIGASTGSSTVQRVQADDPSQRCREDGSECTTMRVPISELTGDSEGDTILKLAFEAYQEQGYPDMELIGFKGSNDGAGSAAYVAQGSVYEQAGASNLQWHVLVAMPMGRSTADAVLKDDTAFVIVCVLASLGVVGCFLLFMVIFRKRQERAFINGDWRFTSAFILGCSALNLSTYTLLGDNTDALCSLRMWSFNLLFAIALSPLIVKVWRMRKIMKAAKRMARLQISNTRALLLTLPIPGFEILLLLVFSLVDPPRQTETLMLYDDSAVQTITCTFESEAFFIAQGTVHTILIAMGCFLAYRSRKLDPKYGEAKQLGFAMYNIAFTMIIIVTILRVTDIEATGQVILQAIGVLWGTLFSAFAFVLPRLIEVEKATASAKTRASVQAFLKKTSDWQLKVSDVSTKFQALDLPKKEQYAEGSPKFQDLTESAAFRVATATDDAGPPAVPKTSSRPRLTRISSWTSGYVSVH